MDFLHQIWVDVVPIGQLLIEGIIILVAVGVFIEILDWRVD